MALRALEIVKEEIARAIAVNKPGKRVLLETVGEVIEERIKKECIDQPDPDEDPLKKFGEHFGYETEDGDAAEQRYEKRLEQARDPINGTEDDLPF